MPIVAYSLSSPVNSFAILASVISGGLAGACVSTLLNRIFHWRELRTKLYPKVLDLYGAYMIRMETPEGRYWETIVGNNPAPEDVEFVDHRSQFISELVAFNELKEARELRRVFAENMAAGGPAPRGSRTRLDLHPETAALAACVALLHKKLKL